MLAAKLGFMQIFASELKAFNSKSYQTKKPLLPFLYHDLYLTSRFIKADVLKNVNDVYTLLQVNVMDKKNLIIMQN